MECVINRRMNVLVGVMLHLLKRVKMIKVIINETICDESINISLKRKLHVIQIEVDEVAVRAKEMIDVILDTSWISKLDLINQISYEARAKRTIDKLVREIFEKITDDVTEEFGEYLISLSAQDALEVLYSHKTIPLAELFKEKVIGNPGFDFHTESSDQIICFGEAKYSENVSRYSDALEQIIEFIGLGKDASELADLRNFVSENAINNATANKRGYVAAFSINAKNPSTIIHNALNSDYISSLSDCNELYLIGVVIKC